MKETPDFTCDWCGKVFPADPRTMVESGFSAGHEAEHDPADNWKGGTPQFEKLSLEITEISPDTLESMKREMGLNDDELAELLRTGSVKNGASCVCLECQDSGVEEVSDV